MSKKLINIIKTKKFIAASALAGLIIGAGNLVAVMMFLALDKMLGSQKIYDYIASESVAEPDGDIQKYLIISAILLFVSFALSVALYILAYRVAFTKLCSKTLFTKSKMLAQAVTLAYIVGNAILGYGISYSSYFLLKDQFGDKTFSNDLVSGEGAVYELLIDFVLIPLIIFYFAQKRAKKHQQELFR